MNNLHMLHRATVIKSLAKTPAGRRIQTEATRLTAEGVLGVPPVSDVVSQCNPGFIGWRVKDQYMLGDKTCLLYTSPSPRDA